MANRRLSKSSSREDIVTNLDNFNKQQVLKNRTNNLCYNVHNFVYRTSIPTVLEQISEDPYGGVFIETEPSIKHKSPTLKIENLCPKCGKSFRRASAYAGHLKFHELTMDVLYCAQCDKKFEHRKDHQQHVKDEHSLTLPPESIEEILKKSV